MQRRTVLKGVATAASVALAGCNGDDGDVVVDERVQGDERYPFDAEAGDEIDVTVDLEAGFRAIVIVEGPDEDLLDDETETEDTWTITAQTSGAHAVLIIVDDGRAAVTVRVQ